MNTENPNFKVMDGGKQEQERDWDESLSYTHLHDQSFNQAEDHEEKEIKIRRPRAKEYFRVAQGEPGEACILWDDREAWLVRPDLALHVRGQIEFCKLYLAVNEDGEVFLLPLRDPQMHEDRPGEDSKRRAVRMAQEAWVRMEWGKKFKYRIFTPKNKDIKGDPKWPTLGLSDSVKMVKKERFIDSPDNRLLQKAAETEVSGDDV
jgi:hypothetical protein